MKHLQYYNQFSLSSINTRTFAFSLDLLTIQLRRLHFMSDERVSWDENKKNPIKCSFKNAFLLNALFQCHIHYMFKEKRQIWFPIYVTHANIIHIYFIKIIIRRSKTFYFFYGLEVIKKIIISSYLTTGCRLLNCSAGLLM